MLELDSIKNKIGEKLDISLEGQDINKGNKVIVMAHGFGTDKHERGLFDQISEILASEYVSVLRFSYSGFGKSQGDQKTKTLDTMSEDLSTVLDYVESHKKQDALITIIAFSMGNTVMAKTLANNEAIKPDKVILVNPSEFGFKDRMQDYFKAKSETIIDEKGIWHLQRADGSVTYISPGFWDSIGRSDDQEASMKKMVNKYNTVLFRAVDDEVVNIDSALDGLSFTQVVKLRGNHNYSDKGERKVFLNKLSEVCLKS